jgi:hypothetical protein
MMLLMMTFEGPIRRTKEGGSEWEPIKILLEGDGDSKKTNTASNTRLRLTTQVGQVNAATRVLLDEGTNKQPSEPRTHQHAQRKLARLAACAAPVRPVTPVGPVNKAGQAGGYSSRTTNVPKSLSDFSRLWNQNTTCKEGEPFTNPSKTTPNR